MGVMSQVPSLQHTSYFSSSRVVSCAFSALWVYSKFGHHPHPLGYLCAKFRFCGDLHCWASPWRKTAYSINHSLTQSLTQLIWCPRNWSFRFGTGQNRWPKKWAWIGIFKPVERHSPVDACLVKTTICKFVLTHVYRQTPVHSEVHEVPCPPTTSYHSSSNDAVTSLVKQRLTLKNELQQTVTHH